MNDERRKEIREVIETLKPIKEWVSSLHAEEQAAYESLPVNFDGSDQAQAMVSSTEELFQAEEWIETAMDRLNDAIWKSDP